MTRPGPLCHDAPAEPAELARTPGRIEAALAAPHGQEPAAADDRARAEFGAIRRLSVPRILLARVLELAVVLDRGQALVEAGHAVTVTPVFAAESSPRNLAVLAAPRRRGDT